MKRSKTYSIQRLLMLLFTFSTLSFTALHAQRTVNGKVIDSDGIPLPGVNIVVKGTTVGSITDMDGNFTIDVRSDDDILIYSMVGMLSEEIIVGNQTAFSVVLIEDLVGLDEVIVVGYGTMKKSDLSGSIVSVGEEEITEVKSFDVMESLQGKMAGVDITQDGGRTGSTSDILIRGKRSLNASNDPLFIVDGIPYGSNIDLNANDIQSIEVLKDASSTAIYGSRGANGVIIVTTKKGKEGQAKIFFNTYFGLTQPYQKIPVFDREGYITAKTDANRDEDWNEAPLENVFLGNEWIGYEAGTETDWQDVTTQNGTRQDYHLGIMGGNDKTNYSTSLSYSNEKGITLSDNFKRYTFKVSLESDVKSFLRVGGSAMLVFGQRDGRGVRFTDAIRSSPIVAAYDSTGKYIFEANLPSPRKNPLAFTDDSELKTSMRVFSNVFAQINFAPSLNFRTSFGLILDNDREGFSYPQKAPDVGRIESGVQLDNELGYTWTNLLNFDKEFGKNSLNIMLGHEVRYDRNEYYSMWGELQTFPRNLWWNMGSVDQATNEANSNLREKSLVSAFGRINYNYNDLVIINATGRYDGASQLSEGNKWQFFPSISGALRLKNFAFMKPVETISDLKIRAGWGVSGNASVNAYATAALLNKYPMYYQFGDPGGESNLNGYRPEFLASKDLTWETTDQINLGLDLGLFKNRVAANLDYYQSNTEGVLLPARLPISTGFFTVMTNAGEVETKGFELMLQTVNINRGGFVWDMSIAYGRHKEKIVSLTSGITSDEANGWFVGEPLDVYYDFKKIGIWQLEDSVLAADYGYVPGDIRIQDIDGNDTINFDDRVVVGSERPKWSGSWVNTFRYKGIDLTINIYARMGQMIDADAYSFDPRMYDNMLAYDYWTPYNPTNEAPRLNAALAETDFESTLRYRDGSFIKVKNITLGYTLPIEFTERIKISKFRVYFTSSNPFILYSQLEEGIDPERNGSFSWPLSRTFLFGLNVEF